MTPLMEVQSWLEPLFLVSLKATAVLLLAFAAARAMRGASAAARHLMWSVALAGVVLLPALELVVPALPVLPRMEVPVTLSRSQPVAETPVAARPGTEAAWGERSALPAASSELLVQSDRASGERVADSGFDLSLIVSLLWLLGAGVVLGRLVAGVGGVWWMGRRATMVTDGSWLHLAHELGRRLGLTRGVTLLRGNRGWVPMTWGVLQPIIWLPAGSEAWPPERRTVVLAHELAHVRRRDALTQWIAHLALVVYWFNPMVWIAARKLREERERACDDAVLSIGTRPSDYADHLLDIVRSYGAQTGPASTMAMARRSQFEGRLLAVLDRAVPRGGVTRRAVFGSSAFVLMAVLPAAALRAGAVQEPPTQGEPPSGDAFDRGVSLPPTHPAVATSISSEQSTAGPLGENPPQDDLRGRASELVPDTIPRSIAAGSQVPVSLVSLIQELQSDGDKAALLMRAARLPDRSPELLLEVIRASRTISSSGDRASVLTAVLQQPNLSGRELSAVFSAAEAMDSDGDAAIVLSRAARHHRTRIQGEVYDAFLAAVRSINSDGDRAVALSALLESPASHTKTSDKARSGGGSGASAWNGNTSLVGVHHGEPSYQLDLTAQSVVLNGSRDGVASLEPGGFLRITHTLLPGYPDSDPLRPKGSGETLSRHLTISRSAGGELRYDYQVNGSRSEFGDEGRAWLSRILREIHKK